MKTSERDQAIKAYNDIKNGKVTGVKIHTPRVIKIGSITVTLTIIISALAIAYALVGCSEPEINTERIGVHHTHPNGAECRYVGRVYGRNYFTYCVEVE
jgi:hypothetical protein